jgi:hypothetical protein
MGYMALLRNCHNIAKHVDDDEVFNEFLNQLSNGKRIQKARVMPYRIVTAAEQLDKWEDVPVSRKTSIYRALVNAMDAACDGIKKLGGKSIVVLDQSGSMEYVFKNASMMTAIIQKTQEADVLKFDNIAEWWVPKYRSVLENADAIFNSFRGGGTSYESAFNMFMDKKYDRIFVISDMQTWDDSYCFSPAKMYHEYVKEHGPAKLYLFDVSGYGTLLHPEDHVHILGGYTLDIYDILEALEMDKEALIKMIENTEI